MKLLSLAFCVTCSLGAYAEIDSSLSIADFKQINNLPSASASVKLGNRLLAVGDDSPSLYFLNEDFQITSNEALTWNEIYRLTAAAAGVPVPKLVHIASELLIAHEPDWEGSLLGDKSHTALFDNSKLREAVPGLEAKIPFAEGVKRTIAWFDADPSRSAPSVKTNAQMEAILEAYAKAWPNGEIS